MKLTKIDAKNYPIIMIAFARMGDGLRFGELLAMTGIEEGRLWRLLTKLVKAGSLADNGERGYCLRRAVALAA